MSITIDGAEISAITIDGEEVLEVTIDGIVVWKLSRLFYCDDQYDRIHELNINTLASMRYVSCPGSTPTGIGGIEGRLYHCRTGNAYELNPDTLAVIKTFGFTYFTGIGGMMNRLFNCYNGQDYTVRIYERNPDTFASINYTTSPSSEPTGMGGMESRLFHCDNASNKIYELNPDTLAVINQGSSGSIPNGIGGTKDRLFYTELYGKDNYEINPDTFAVINSNATPENIGSGIGGIK